MKQNFTEIIALIDNNIAFDLDPKFLIGTCNSFLQGFNLPEKEINVTFLKYSDTVETFALNLPVSNFSLKKFSVKKNGASSLVDSAADTIIKTGERYANQPCEEHPENIIFIMLVSSPDNASKHFTYHELNDMISHQSDIYKWKFYLMTSSHNLTENIAVSADNTILFNIDDLETFGDGVNKLKDMILSKILIESVESE